jgi:hypothetical protein
LGSLLTPLGPDDEGTINVAPKKMSKALANSGLKLKKTIVKQTKPGNWREGIVADCMFMSPLPSRFCLGIEALRG